MTQPTALPAIMVAPNGARRTQADHPALPITIEETVETAVACFAAGADGIHAHVRDDDGAHSLDVGRYRALIQALNEAVPGMFVQVTSEAAGVFDAAAQQAMIRDLRPASVSLALSEMIRSDADLDAAREFYAWAHDQGIGLHHIAYKPEQLAWLLSCLDDGTIPDRHARLQLVLGSYAGITASQPSDLDHYTTLLDARTCGRTFEWMICAFGPTETACLVETAKRGGKLRVGFENSLWNADGSLARDNAARVAEVRAALDAEAITL